MENVEAVEVAVAAASKQTLTRTSHATHELVAFRRKRLQPFPQTFTTLPANVCNPSHKRLHPQRQCTATENSVHCNQGLSALQPKMQCTAVKIPWEGVSPQIDYRIWNYRVNPCGFRRNSLCTVCVSWSARPTQVAHTEVCGLRTIFLIEEQRIIGSTYP